MTTRSQTAIHHTRSFCESYFVGRYDIEIIDIYQEPWLARDDQILAVPTLVRVLPLPLRRFVGDLSQTRRLLEGFGLEASQ